MGFVLEKPGSLPANWLFLLQTTGLVLAEAAVRAAAAVVEQHLPLQREVWVVLAVVVALSFLIVPKRLRQ